jgi:prepilin-type N-terminal cleavage/methylation domain-containing protein
VSRACLRGDRRGLTLIELVVTLTILALAGSLVSGAFVTGLRAWQSGLRSGREELVARIVLERIATQLRAAIPSPAERNGEHAVAFDATEDQLRFVTPAAGGPQPVQVSYRLETDGGAPHLVFREYPWPDKDFFAESHPRSEEKIPEVTGFSVKVVKRTHPSDIDTSGLDNQTGASLSEEWSPLDEELPASVSVEIVVNAEGRQEPRQFQITVPVLAQEAP